MILIITFKVDPILSFGICNAVSNLSRVLTFLLYNMFKSSDIPLNLSLRLQKVKDLSSDRAIYLLPGSLRFAVQLAYSTLLVDFFDQLYFIIFVTDTRVIGELTLIRGFGNLIIRFLYAPIGDITYNLYSKLILEAQRDLKNS